MARHRKGAPATAMDMRELDDAGGVQRHGDSQPDDSGRLDNSIPRLLTVIRGGRQSYVARRRGRGLRQAQRTEHEPRRRDLPRNQR
jgi:hypothetical protein